MASTDDLNSTAQGIVRNISRLIDAQRFNASLGIGATIAVNTLGTSSTQTQGSSQYAFASWSDGGAQSHSVTVPDTGALILNRSSWSLAARYLGSSSPSANSTSRNSEEALSR